MTATTWGVLFCLFVWQPPIEDNLDTRQEGFSWQGYRDEFSKGPSRQSPASKWSWKENRSLSQAIYNRFLQQKISVGYWCSTSKLSYYIVRVCQPLSALNEDGDAFTNRDDISQNTQNNLAKFRILICNYLIYLFGEDSAWVIRLGWI